MWTTPTMTSRQTATDTRYWDRLRGHIQSGAGGWRVGEAVYSHGYSLLGELVGELSWVELFALYATGRRQPRPLCRWLEAFFLCMSWPDPRIWCNQIGALGGSAGNGPVAATCAGILASDGVMYGPRTLIDATQFLRQALQARRSGTSIDALLEQARPGGKGKPRIVGFARPLASGDARVEALERVRRELALSRGEHLQLAFDVEARLLERYAEGMNVAGYVAGFLSDHGFAPQEIYRVSALCVAAGVLACQRDQEARPSGSFLPLRCDDVHYTGTAPREVPV